MRIGFDAKRSFLNNTGLGNYSRDTIRILSLFYPNNDYFLFTPKTKNTNRLNLLKQKRNINQLRRDIASTSASLSTSISIII